jgi:putative glycosyltransferase (TIGR04372 family)
MLLPLTIALHLAGYRRITVFTQRIGHLALEPDCLLKEQALGFIPKHRWFILAPPKLVANRHLLSYWKPLIRVYEGRFSCYILASMSRWGFMRHDISRYILAVNKAQAAYRIYALWGDRPPLLALAPADEEWGGHALRELGLPDGVWFVCVHVREPGFSPVDEELHAHRNGSIEATLPAIQEITRRGGWVIRIGDPSMQPLPPISHVINYAHHSTKCERLDIILCARARFLLGNTSGIALVSSIFGVPCAIVNMIPTPTLWFNTHDLSIPKLLWSEHLGRHLRFDEIMASPVSNFRYAKLFIEARIRAEENSAEDIRDLTMEMLDRLEGCFAESDADRERQVRYHSLYRIGHHSFGSASRIGTLFLRKYQNLMISNDTRQGESSSNNSR